MRVDRERLIPGVTSYDVVASSAMVVLLPTSE
jgi:hypothetical protein